MYRNKINKPLNILHIFSGDLWAGAEVMIFNLLRQLVSNPNIRIIALSLNEGILSRKLQQLGIKTFIIPEEKHSFPVILLKARKILRDYTFDIIHSHRYKENLLSLFLGKILGTKRLVSTVHGLTEQISNKQNEKKSTQIKTKFDYFILKHFFYRVIAVSHEMKKILTHKYYFRQEKVNVIHNGIDIQQFIQSVNRSANQQDNKSTNNFFHIGTVGRLTPVKGYFLFLEIAAEMNKKRKDVRFHILGDGPLRARLVSKSNELNINDVVEFHHPEPDPVSFYRDLDIYLNTSYNEGLPLTILEAMASGACIVAPNVGGILEIIINESNGILMEGRDPVKYADKCAYLLDNNIRFNLVNASTQTVSNKFSSEKMAESYLRFYDSATTLAGSN